MSSGVIVVYEDLPVGEDVDTHGYGRLVQYAIGFFANRNEALRWVLEHDLGHDWDYAPLQSKSALIEQKED